MATNITTRIALKSDISSNWEKSSLVALKGEYLFDSNRKYIKVGDGQHTWTELTTIKLPKEAIDGLKDVDTNTIYDLSSNGTTLALISADGTALISADGTADSQYWKEVKSWDISALISTAVEAEATRAKGVEETLNTAISAHQTVFEGLSGKVDAEITRAEGVESGLNSRLTTAEADIDVLETGATALSGRMTTAESDIKAEETRATKAEEALAGRLDTIKGEGEGSIKKALADAKGYADTQDAVVSADTLDKAKKYTDKKVEDLSVSLSTTVATDYVKKTDVKSAITENNKVVTETDIADIAGAMHFRGLVEKQGAESDIEAINSVIKKPYLSGDVALVGTAEYVYDGEQWKSFGDEGLYETKTDATAKLNEAKTYTDAAISALDVAEVTVGAAKTIASISETDGKIAVVTADIKIAESQVTDLTSDLGTLSSMVKAEEVARIAADKALDSKIADEVTACNEAISAAIKTLDVTDTAVEKQFVTAVSETDGKITVTRSALVSADIPALEYDALGAAAAAETAAKAYADEKDTALHTTITGKIATAKSEAISTVVGTDADLSTASTVKGAKKYTDEKVAEVQSNSLSGVTLNGEKFSVANNVATLTIEVISCGGAL